MKIGIDISSATEKKPSGVGHYTLHMVRALLALDRSNEYVLFTNSARPQPLPEFSHPNTRYFRSRYPSKIFNGILALTHFPQLDRLVGGVDVFFLPNPNFFGFSSRCRVITTIHDLSFELWPDVYTAKTRLWHRLLNVRRLCQRSNAIIAVSEHTKRDITNLYAVDGHKIMVVTPGLEPTGKTGLSASGWDAQMQKHAIPQEYALYVGNVEPRKNIETLIEVFSGNQVPTDLHLVLAGSCKNLSPTLAREIAGNPRIHLVGYVHEELKRSLYSHARMFLYPSLYEGFGFPPLEAMSAGVPVITSCHSSLSEIAGPGALLVDPRNPRDWQDAICQLTYDTLARKLLIERGFRCARPFTWERSAQRLLSLMNQTA